MMSTQAADTSAIIKDEQTRQLLVLLLQSSLLSVGVAVSNRIIYRVLSRISREISTKCRRLLPAATVSGGCGMQLMPMLAIYRHVVFEAVGCISE